MPTMLHTGGAVGADALFAGNALISGLSVTIHSFEGHRATLNGLRGANVVRHSANSLTKKAFPAYEKANETLRRSFPYKEYVRNLILRDFFQIEKSEYVFAVAPLQNKRMVKGGTGYAVQMAIDRHLPVVVFDDNRSLLWHYFSYKAGCFVPIDHEPPPGFLLSLGKANVTGIGSRSLSPRGEGAIRLLFASK